MQVARGRRQAGWALLFGKLHHDLVVAGEGLAAGDDGRYARFLQGQKQAAGAEILEFCVNVGGVITGEHGIGSEKRDYMHLVFEETDLEAMRYLRSAFDPDEVCNPGKIFPTTRFCVEANPKARGYDRVPLGE